MPFLLIRQMKSGEEQQVASLVSHVFYDHIAPHYSTMGVHEFLRCADPQGMVSRAAAGHWVLVAEDGNRIIAMIEMRAYHHVSMLFVAGEYHRQGIARQLLREALSICYRERPDLDCVSVYASPNSMKAYERLGFRAQAPEQTITGIRFTPMRLQLGAIMEN